MSRVATPLVFSRLRAGAGAKAPGELGQAVGVALKCARM